MVVTTIANNKTVDRFGPLVYISVTSIERSKVVITHVKFAGIPCTPVEQVITGTIDVVADGKVVASKKVQITVPPCALKADRSGLSVST